MPKRSAAAIADLVQPKAARNAYLLFSNDPKTRETARDELPPGHKVSKRKGRREE